MINKTKSILPFMIIPPLSISLSLYIINNRKTLHKKDSIENHINMFIN